MEKIIEKYVDSNGYIKNIYSLYEELVKNDIPMNDINNILLKIIEKNKSIMKELQLSNEKIENIILHKQENVEELDYRKIVVVSSTSNKEKKDYLDVSFYIEYINQHTENKMYLEILPVSIDKDSIKILDTILSYYLKEINLIKYFFGIENSVEEKNRMLEDLIIYEEIFESIKKHKENLFYSKNQINSNKNNLVYYMNGDKAYIYYDIVDYPNIHESILILLKSIEDGTFKGIKAFTHNDKLKGLLEVRDVANSTRVVFEPLGNKKYCIIYAIVDKKESNHLYKQRLYTRYKRYCLEKDNIKEFEKDEIKKLILKEV